jgi:hypothetical protein
MASICQTLDNEITSLKQQIQDLINGGGGDPGELLRLRKQLHDAENSYAQFQCNIQPWSPTSNSHGVLASSDNVTVFAAVSQEGRLFYNWWTLGGGGVGWHRILDAPLSDEAPSIALVGDQHDYLFVIVRERGTGILYLNQGALGSPSFVGWNPAI